jgi:hypothetical protein
LVARTSTRIPLLGILPPTLKPPWLTATSVGEVLEATEEVEWLEGIDVAEAVTVARVLAIAGSDYL